MTEIIFPTEYHKRSVAAIQDFFLQQKNHMNHGIRMVVNQGVDFQILRLRVEQALKLLRRYEKIEPLLKGIRKPRFNYEKT